MAISPKAEMAAFRKLDQASPPAARVPTRLPIIMEVFSTASFTRDSTSLEMSFIFSVSTFRPMPTLMSPSCARKVCRNISVSSFRGRMLRVGVVTALGAPTVFGPLMDDAIVAHFE